MNMATDAEALSSASAAAAEMIASGAADDAPAPEPAPEAPAEGEQTAAPAEDMFPRKYVEELREEAAEYRTRARTFEDAFADMTEQERRGFLDLASSLESDPARALEQVERVAEQLRSKVEPAPQAQDGQPLLTPEQVQRMVEEKLAERDQAQQQQGRVQEVFNEAAAINEAYAPGSDALVQLLHVAQTDPAAQGTLQGAHMVLMGKLDGLMQQAVEDYRQSLSPSNRRPVQGGTPTTGKPAEPPKTFDEAAKRAQEILGRTF